MNNLQYHKGQHCVYSSRFCQEGYCSECEVCKNRTHNNEYDIDRTGSQLVYSKVTLKEMGLVLSQG
jgi:hypothetical protein